METTALSEETRLKRRGDHRGLYSALNMFMYLQMDTLHQTRSTKYIIKPSKNKKQLQKP